ncbi:hypothetical protein [Lolliginicoccus levis]|uniref:hypothetical protein n=1 Tax=Lolliginicoccus levis TaxID=2919542 RepID=UPI00241DE196|nr:hypothetical protein [Lolliginicoccus levis]
MIVRIFHNIARDEQGRHAGFAGYRPGHQVELVFAYSAEGSDDELLERAFFLTNIGSGPLADAYRARGLRSLSVGDVLAIGQRYYGCDRIGWQPIERPARQSIAA